MAKSRLLTALCISVVWALLPASSSAQIERSVGDDGVIEIGNSKGRGQKRAAKESPNAVMPAHVSTTSNRFDDYIEEAAALYRLPSGLIRAVIKVESNFDPRAVSHANAHGLMQLLPSTAERMMVTDIFDPRQNILGGARYLRILANTFNGNLELTLAGYNAGEGAVARYGGIPPYRETQNYVAKVTQYYQEYR
jgi:soluble lytic murein transglycosylase-like protein